MSQMNKVQDDEIDLFEFFQTLWNGKWLISAFVAIAVLLGGGFLLSKDALFESKLIYSVNTIPPFYKDTKVSTDFKQKFYSNSVFKDWKESNSNASIVFEDFSATEVVDGFVMSKDGGQLATLASEKKGRFFVLVKSDQLPILDDFFKYTTHINATLKKDYIQRAKEELNIIEARYKDISNADNSMISNILSIDRYIVSAEKGANVLTFQRPTIPKKVSPKSSPILAMSVVLGGLVGVLFILIRNAVTKRKEQLAKA